MTRAAAAPVAIVVLVALIARIAAQIALGFYMRPESWEQDMVARSLAAGGGFAIEYHGTTYHALVHPLYPFLFAAAYALFGATAVTGGLLVAAIGSAGAAAAFDLCRRSGLALRTATVAGLFVALHPGLLVYSAKLHPLALDALLLTLAAIVLVELDHAFGRRTISAAGILTGIVALERVSFLPFIVLGLAAVMLRRGPRPPHLKALAAITAIAAIATIIILPWSWRNVTTIGTPLVVSTSGLQLWLGNNPNATGGALRPDATPVFDADPAVRDAVWGRPELEQDRVLRDLALRYIADDAGGAAARTTQRFAAFWWEGPTTGLTYPRAWATTYLLYWGAVAVMAAIGAVLLSRSGQRYLVVLVALACVTVSLVHAITYVEGRHRWAVEPLVLVLASAGLLATFDAMRQRIQR